MNAINLTQALEGLKDYWSPKVIGRVNDQYIKVAKVMGELVWHKHDDEDELFHVLKGKLVIQLEGEGSVHLGEGDMYIVPKGKMHNPVASEECWIMLVETVTTKHTGDVEIPRTRSIAEQMS